jgi:hypothetical protein
VFTELSPSQAKAFIDAEQIHLALRDAQEKMQPYTGGMHWKTVNGKQYLYRTTDGRGTAKSLGPRCADTETLLQNFQQRRAELDARLATLEARQKEQTRMVRALRAGSAPPILARVCQALCLHKLMGSHILIIGTNALHAYEALAGVRFVGDVTATTDMDMLWKHKARLTAVARDIGPEGLLGVLKRVDKSFEIHGQQTFRAINADGYMVDLIRQTPTPPWKTEPHNLGEQDAFVATDLPNMKWMLSVPSVRQFVVADNGMPFEMAVPDPRAFMLFKAWLSTQPDREPVKRGRDAAQAQAMRQLLQDHLPQYPLTAAPLRAFPLEVIRQHGLA